MGTRETCTGLCKLDIFEIAVGKNRVGKVYGGLRRRSCYIHLQVSPGFREAIAKGFDEAFTNSYNELANKKGIG